MFVCLCCVTGSVCKEVHNGHSARRYIVDGMFICVVRLGLCARCLLDKMFVLCNWVCVQGGTHCHWTECLFDCVVQLGLCARKYILDGMCVVSLGLCARRYILDRMFIYVVQLGLHTRRCLPDRRKHHHSPVRAMEWSQPAASIL